MNIRIILDAKHRIKVHVKEFDKLKTLSMPGKRIFSLTNFTVKHA
jgi:hypothetical protein